jgi:histidine triad (HIT) family protein
MSTIFSKIIQGQIPCFKIAEDPNYFAFLDINPVAHGHTLVVPKVEVDYVFDLDDGTIGGLMQFARRIARGIDLSLQPVRTGVIVEGLEIPHAHIHLIPMYPDRKGFSLGRKVDLSREEMQRIATGIREGIVAAGFSSIVIPG